MVLEGNAHVFGDHINTDYIISGKYKSRLTDLNEMAKHIMEDIRPDFYKEIQPGNFIVGGLNFGCGSSREAAAWVIKKAGIAAVLAKDFARIFFRNAINVGVPVLRVDTGSVQEGVLEHHAAIMPPAVSIVMNHDPRLSPFRNRKAAQVVVIAG